MKKPANGGAGIRKVIAIAVMICMIVTGTMTGTGQYIVPDGIPDDMEAAAASCPKLKTIDYEATGNQRNDIIGFAKTQIGYTEGGGNNTYFGKWYGCNYNPWCAMFVTWAARKAGVTKAVIPSKANADRSWAKNQGIYHKSKYWGGSYTPKKGDLIYFSWSVRDWADHIGMVTGTSKSGGTTYVNTIEGNKHDKVVEDSYALNNRYILGYASPKYTTGKADEEETTETTTETNPSETTPTTVAEGNYTLKYRDGLDSTSNDEEDAIIAPVKGTYGQDLILSTTKFTRKGYTYKKWKLYKQDSSGNLISLCRDKATGTVEKWYKSSLIPDDYDQVFVPLGEALNLKAKVSGTVYASPKWSKKKYAVTFDANGGTGAPEVQKKVYGKELVLSDVKPVRTGYNFKGWAASNTATAVEYAPGSTYTKNKKITLYAVWSFKAYKAEATAKINTRSGPAETYDVVSTIKKGSTIKIYDVRDGWGKVKDGSWLDLRYTMRLNATEYTLEYTDGVEATTNDSVLIQSQTVKYGKAFTASATRFEQAGFSYNKWMVYRLINDKKFYLCTDKNTGGELWYRDGLIPDNCVKVKVKPGGNLTIATAVGDRIFITPMWKEITYKITYNANGGVSAPKEQIKQYDYILVLRKHKPKREGYKFLGWAESSTSVDPVFAPGDQYIENRSAELFAVWKSTAFKVKVKANINKRKGPGSSYSVIGSVSKGKVVTIIKKKNGWGKLKKGGWIKLSYTKKITTNKTSSNKTSSNSSNTNKALSETTAQEQTSSSAGDETGNTSSSDQTFTVRVTAENGVNARADRDKDSEIKTSYEKGEKLTIKTIKNGWGKVKGSGYWIMLKYTKIISGYKVTIDTEDLNQRSGPGSDYDSEGYIDEGTYTVVRINGSWAKIKETGFWVSLAYTKRVND